MPATTTGTQVLNSSLAVMGEIGSIEYNAAAVILINMLCDKLYPYSDNYVVATIGVRPQLTHITALSGTLGIDDTLAQSVLPYGLASQLMLSEDLTQAANFESIFQERLSECRSHLSTEGKEIEDVYNFYV